MPQLVLPSFHHLSANKCGQLAMRPFHYPLPPGSWRPPLKNLQINATDTTNMHEQYKVEVKVYIAAPSSVLSIFVKCRMVRIRSPFSYRLARGGSGAVTLIHARGTLVM